MDDTKYGSLINPDVLLHRKWFVEMCAMIGIICLHRAPLPNKTYNNYGELDSFYEAPQKLGCIFEDHPSQQTLKKLGWVSELQENASIVHVSYDENIQKGSLIIIPSGIDGTKGRLFRVNKMAVDMVYPASISCEIAPMYENTFEKANLIFTDTTTNLLADDEEDEYTVGGKLRREK